MVSKLLHMKFSIKLTVISLFMFLSLLIITVALSLQYYFSQSLAKESSDALFRLSAQSISDKINSLDVESSDLALLLSQYEELAHNDNDQTLRPITKIMAQAMLQKPYLYAVYVGYENGNFYELVNLDSSKNLRDTLKATPSDRWLVIHIFNSSESNRERKFFYFDSEFKNTHQRSEKSQYFANVRPWYREAMKSDSTIKTRPYIFHNTQKPGTTYAKRIATSNNVIAVDISMETLSSYLQQHRSLNETSLKDSNTIIFDQSGKIYAHSYAQDKSDLNIPATKLPLTTQEQQYIADLGALRISNEKNWPPFDFSYSGEPQGYSIDLFNLIAAKLGLKMEYSNGYNWNELVDLFQHNKLDILHSVFHTPQRDSWGLFTAPYYELFPVLVNESHIKDNVSLEQLNTAGKTVAIPAGWAFVNFVKKEYPNINVLEVDDTLSALQAVLNKDADAAFDNNEIVQYIVDRYSLTGLNLKTDIAKLPSSLDQRLRFLVHSDKPELQNLLDKAINSLTQTELDALSNKWFHGNAVTKLRRSIESGVVPSTAFTDLARSGKKETNITIGKTNYTIYVYHAITNIGPESYVGIIVPTESMQSPYMNQVRLSLEITLGLLVLLTPTLFFLAKMIVTPVNQLAVENKKIMERKFKEVKAIPSRIKEVDDLSNSILSMASSIEEYQNKQQELVDVFIQLIAQEIDDKSPYTGAHCERVPEIAMMLAQSASESSLPAFEHFKFETTDQWREFKIAAWLHDCGKVTTPEHVIDKGSKLETIYNRIHEIRTRFEVLWRDAEIEFWKSIASGLPKEPAKQLLSERHAKIVDDFAFVAECNIGTDFVDETKVTRIKDIARQTWTRHLDNRLGLSPQESKHIESIPQSSLPIQENLLMNAPAHIIPWIRSPKKSLSKEFCVNVPDVQANLGEVYNLSIGKGTLTDEDRYRINEHIISTIQILEALPLPEELSRVPEIAGGHHEKLDGTGYPKCLSAEDLSIEARILAIADVFEALTASDRPYKQAKTLSEAIDILATMTKENHLDENLFKLLLSSNIHEKYAKRFLANSQIDQVDLAKYL